MPHPRRTPAPPVGTDLDRAAALLRGGGLVAFGTETVYGLGADAADTAAAARIFAAKGRPRFDPLIVHLPDADRLAEFAADVPQAARRLTARFWPGPLTVVLPKTAAVPDLVTAGLPAVALRVPAPPATRELLRRAGVPVAAPSANRFGAISPTTAAHVAGGLGDAVDYVFDTGPCPVGVESTVVGFEHGRPVVLRPGGVTVEAIAAVVGPVEVRTGTADPSGPQASPGTLSRHYAPDTPLRLVDDPADVPDADRVGLLSPGPTPHAGRFAACEVLATTGDDVEAAANFYAALRRLDAAGLVGLAAVPFPPHGLGVALNDRLRRAAAG